MGFGYGPDPLNSNCVLIWGSNPAVTHTPSWNHIIEAKSRGAKIIVVDPMYTETASNADIFLQIRPGTDSAWHLEC